MFLKCCYSNFIQDFIIFILKFTTKDPLLVSSVLISDFYHVSSFWFFLGLPL
uniref:Uncharacterized protein n=1 Tax=Octopus bimaculoides TaxID=37653 RepID=A0A0L8H3Q3_OCTBM